jgi:protein-tyrosine kinase
MTLFEQAARKLQALQEQALVEPADTARSVDSPSPGHLELSAGGAALPEPARAISGPGLVPRVDLFLAETRAKPDSVVVLAMRAVQAATDAPAANAATIATAMQAATIVPAAPVVHAVISGPAARAENPGAVLSSKDVPPQAGAPAAARTGPVVELDAATLDRAGILVSTRPRSVLSEEFRRLKQPLLKSWREAAAQNSPRDPSNSLIMVTSAVPGEGKTFCAINLAMSLAAEVDAHVLLVDADVIHPDVLNRLGVRPQRGLLDLVENEQLDPDEVIATTNIPKLELLGSGPPRTTATELLASLAMRRVLERLAARRHNQIVVFDGPPLLATNEAQVLAGRVGQVVLVVAAESTPRRIVAQALETIDACPSVVMLLNKALRPALPRAYGYY